MRDGFGYSDATLPHTHTTQPYVTGSSVIGIVYKDGVMLAADNLASYGSLARFRLPRIRKVNDYTLIGASGEMADFDHIVKDLDKLTTKEFCYNDGIESNAHEIYSYLTRVMYQRRSKIDPLWNQVLVAGFDAESKPMLGLVDLYGTAFKDKVIATGYANYIVVSNLRSAQDDNMSEEDARKLLIKCMTVLFYRDARAINEIQIATITKDGPTISEPFKLETDWSIGILPK
jgi:20S proteasome subunit beta 7